MLLTRKSRSQAQITASRANGAKSRGPVTLQGRINSGKHKIKHGFLARTVVLETECLDRYYELLNSLLATYKPVGPAESVLVQKMTAAHWRLIRVWCYQKAAYGFALRRQNSLPAAQDKLTLHVAAFQNMSSHTLNRVENSYDRQFSSALRLLRSEQNIRIRTQHLIENTHQTPESKPETTLI